MGSLSTLRYCPGTNRVNARYKLLHRAALTHLSSVLVCQESGLDRETQTGKGGGFLTELRSVEEFDYATVCATEGTLPLTLCENVFRYVFRQGPKHKQGEESKNKNKNKRKRAQLCGKVEQPIRTYVIR